jgi:ATP-dependent Clp protease protease subunit
MTNRSRCAPAPRLQDDDDERPEAIAPHLAKQLLEGRTILLCGPVTDELSRQIMARLLVLDGQDPEKPIRVFINSPGGAVDAGFAIYDTMRFVKAPVYTICTGLAASAATVILLGGERGRRYALPHTRFLLHQPSTGVQGQASDVIIGAKEILKIRRVVNELLARETGRDFEKIAEDTMRDYWMSAAEAIDYGLIDRTIESAADLD